MRRIHTLFLTVISLTFFGQVNLNSGLNACYSLDGHATDAINALNGTLSAITATTDRFSNPNSALSFSGTALNHVLLPNSPLIKPSNTITLSGWFKPTQVGHQTIIFAKNNLSSNFAAYALTIETTASGYKFNIAHQTGSSTNFCMATTTPVANTWYHIVASVSTGSLAIYVNGVLENSVPASYTFNYDLTKGVVLGGTNEGAFNNPYKGAMDNLRFYNRWLNQSEVTALYQQDPVCNAVAAIPPVAGFTVSGIKLCSGESLTATDLSANNPTLWYWQFYGPATGTSSAQHPVFNFTQPGNYVVALTASNSAGASNTATQSIVVVPNPVLTVIPSLNPSCAGAPVILFASGAASYQWNNQHPGPALYDSPAVNTTYTVAGTDANGCNGVTVHSQSVLPVPVISASVKGAPVCAGQQVTLTATGAGSYTWSTGATSAVAHAVFYAPVSVTVVGTDNGLCTGSAQIAVAVSPCTGIGEAFNDRAAVFPNPTGGWVRIALHETECVSTIIRNIAGETLFSENHCADDFMIDLTSQPSGIYFLELVSLDAKTVRKIIKN